MNPVYTAPLRMGNPVLQPSGMRLAYRGPARMAQNPEEVKKAKTQVAGFGVVALALAAGGTWLGVRTGLREDGFLGFTGWAVAVGSALTALTSIGLLAALPFVPTAPPVTTTSPGILVDQPSIQSA